MGKLVKAVLPLYLHHWFSEMEISFASLAYHCKEAVLYFPPDLPTLLYFHRDAMSVEGGGGRLGQDIQLLLFGHSAEHMRGVVEKALFPASKEEWESVDFDSLSNALWESSGGVVEPR